MTELGGSTEKTDLPLPDGGVLTIGWAALSDVGKRRPVNEDSFIATPPVFAVADGMGGHSAGDLASSAVVKRLAEIPDGTFVTPAGIGLALARAAHDISAFEGVSVLGAGTTVTGIAVTESSGDPYFAVFNVGDSRVYQFREGELEQVTVDHSVVQEMVDAGAITRAQADHHPDSNVITRAIGFNEPPLPDYWILPAEPGLRLLACSDGLTKEVDDGTIARALGAGLDAAQTVQGLVDAALAVGGRDNVTAVLVDVLAITRGA